MSSRRCENSRGPDDARQRDIDILRRELLSGRGRGASAQEVARCTRNRQTLGAVQTAIALELAQLHANMARGDADAIAEDAARVRADLVCALDELTARLAPWLTALGVLAVFGLGLLVRRGWRRRGRRVGLSAGPAA